MPSFESSWRGGMLAEVKTRLCVKGGNKKLLREELRGVGGGGPYKKGEKKILLGAVQPTK